MTRERLPNRRLRKPISFDHWSRQYTGGAGLYPDGRIGEVFLTTGKTGTDLNTMTQDAAIAASMAIQFGCPIKTLRDAFLREDDGRPSGPMGALFDMLAKMEG